MKNYLILLVVLFTACSKNNDPSPEPGKSGCVISQITYKEDGETEIDKLEYDNQLRPVKLIGDGNTTLLSYEYTGNKIIEKRYEDGKVYRETQYTLQNNIITKATYVNNGTGQGFSYRNESTTDYSYNAEGYLTQKKETSVYSSKLDSEASLTVKSTSIYTSTYSYVNGNLDTQTYSYSYDGVSQGSSSVKYTYDTSKTNNLPFEGSGDFIDSFFSGKANKNIVTKQVSNSSSGSNYETAFTYTFDNNGKISSRISTEDGYSETEEFAYSCK